MRWYTGNKTNRKAGELRVLRRFLFIPLKIADETRWLEVADIVQECADACGPLDPPCWYWRNREWGIRLNEKGQRL